MNALIYNASLLVGLVLIGIGDGLQHGVAHALPVVGAVILALTVFGAAISKRG